ncbi:unnamed protein product [Kuraishia capsulata CBS 1993]|uniref:Uncharacterized protein n=1 Tax=Kuraishia capsulata CBS 1993 TaxID=1382522 RepID=W6MRU5_9ASCO|nr:uncharacterized protein KUCA_T00000500001 [Kuraishia capsulata CBS 1993]CDK24535.1 unnamed protein product [Kuraishia capsulata CBS 1993]
MTKTVETTQVEVKVLHVDSEIQIESLYELLLELYYELVEIFTFRVKSNLLLGCIDQLQRLNSRRVSDSHKNNEVLQKSMLIISEINHAVNCLPRMSSLKSLRLEAVLDCLALERRQLNLVNITDIHNQILANSLSYKHYTSLKESQKTLEDLVAQSVCLTKENRPYPASTSGSAISNLLMDPGFIRFHQVRKERLLLSSRRVF